MARQLDRRMRSDLLLSYDFSAFMARRSDSFRDRHGCTLLQYAAQHEAPGVVKALLAAGCDPNAATTGRAEHLSGGVSGVRAGPVLCAPLIEAAKAGRSDNVAALLNGGAYVAAVNRQGLTALHYAVHMPRDAGRHAIERALACAKLLLAAGADVNAIGRGRETPLHMAAASRAGPEANIGKVVQLLLDRGAIVNAADRQRATPLLLAATFGASASAVEVLLAAGARVDVAGVVEPGGGPALTPFAAAVRRQPGQGLSGIVIGALLGAGADFDEIGDLGLQQRRELGALWSSLAQQLRQEQRVTPALKEVVVKMACERKWLEQERADWKQERSELEQAWAAYYGHRHGRA